MSFVFTDINWLCAQELCLVQSSQTTQDSQVAICQLDTACCASVSPPKATKKDILNVLASGSKRNVLMLGWRPVVVADLLQPLPVSRLAF